MISRRRAAKLSRFVPGASAPRGRSPPPRGRGTIMRTRASSVHRWAIVGLVVLGAQAGPAADGATLRWKFKPGETLHYVIDWKTSTSTAGGDKRVDAKTTLTLDMDWVVREVGGDGA